LAKKKSNKKNKKPTSKSFPSRLGRAIKKLVLWFLLTSVFSVFIFKVINPPITPLMVIRMVQQKSQGRSVRVEKSWMPLEKISPNMVHAILASEDQKFMDHNGFDIDAITNAIRNNTKGKRILGGSTVSQQTAKNVFLWPGRDWVRKGLEVYFTFVMELLWSKERILEVYLNVIEFGDGVYGVEAASKYYFHKSASRLNKMEAAALAAIVPSPLKRNPLLPSVRMQNNIQRIIQNMQYIRNNVKLDVDYLIK